MKVGNWIKKRVFRCSKIDNRCLNLGIGFLRGNGLRIGFCQLSGFPETITALTK